MQNDMVFFAGKPFLSSQEDVNEMFDFHANFDGNVLDVHVHCGNEVFLGSEKVESGHKIGRGHFGKPH